jgi:hypothetical protein
MNTTSIEEALTISPESDKWETKTTVNGPTQEVNTYIEKYFNDYHPSGYGTHVVSTHYHEDGRVTVILVRANCCD